MCIYWCVTQYKYSLTRGYGTCKDCSRPAGKISSFIQEHKRKIAPKSAVTLFNKMCRTDYLNPEFVQITDQLGPGSVVGIATGYRLDGPGIESRWGRNFPHLSRPTLGPIQPPVQWYRVFPGVKERPGRESDPSPPPSTVVLKGQSNTSTPPMGRTACTETKYKYKGALYLNLLLIN